MFRPRTLLLTLIAVSCLSTGISAQASFGRKDPGLFNLKGSIYFLTEEEETSMPADLAGRKIQGVIYTGRLDIPSRDFSEGFPGVTGRFTWFGIIYTGSFQIGRPGLYKWRLGSDDGSRLWIDGNEVIDNDGVHGYADVAAETELAEGPHQIKVWYYQGPPQEVALQLFITPPDGEEKIFSMEDYAGDLAGALKKAGATATADGIRIKLDAAILFDTNKFDLKPAAREAIANVATVIRAYPGASVLIEGHTDATGDDAANQTLSENRANSVEQALLALNPPGDVKFRTKGFGKSRPAGSNDTESGRARNRRVEIVIQP